jgi:hypothetical protein
MMPGNQGNTNGDGLYKYNPAIEKIRTSFQNSEVAQLKVEVSRLKEELMRPKSDCRPTSAKPGSSTKGVNSRKMRSLFD